MAILFYHTDYIVYNIFLQNHFKYFFSKEVQCKALVQTFTELVECQTQVIDSITSQLADKKENILGGILQ